MAAWLLALAPKVIELLAQYIPDPIAREKAVQSLFGMLQDGDRAQMTVNEQEARHTSLFVAGWRPAIGWTCAAALAFEYLVSPLGQWIGFMIGYPVPKPPTLSDNLFELMMGMLGLGALRSLEKIKRVS